MIFLQSVAGAWCSGALSPALMVLQTHNPKLFAPTIMEMKYKPGAIIGRNRVSISSCWPTPASCPETSERGAGATDLWPKILCSIMLYQERRYVHSDHLLDTCGQWTYFGNEEKATNLAVGELLSDVCRPGCRPISTVKDFFYACKRWEHQSAIEDFIEDIMLDTKPLFFVLRRC